MGRSQRHLIERDGYDVSGLTSVAAGVTSIPPAILTRNLAGQTVTFATWFPTGTAFSLASTPTGMSLNASTGLLDGTPTTNQSASTTLTVTYTSPQGPRTVTVPFFYAVGAAAGGVTAGSFTNGVAITPVNFATSFPGGVEFYLSSKPAGTALSVAGTLSGTPTATGTDASAILTVIYPNGGRRSYTWSWTVA